jgi:hypothetical protein
MGLVDRLGNIHGHKTGRFEEKPPKPVGPLLSFPDIDRSDDEQVGEIITDIGIETGIIRQSDFNEALWRRYGECKAKDIPDQEGLQMEIDDAQDFWTNATALGLTEWCSKEEFIQEFWEAKNYDEHNAQWPDPGFSKCPDKDTTRQLREMAKQYPNTEFTEDSDGELFFYRAGRK